MSDNPYPPGPYSVLRVAHPRATLIVDANGRSLANVQAMPPWSDDAFRTSQALAGLLACAPELFEAIEEIYEAYYRQHNSPEDLAHTVGMWVQKVAPFIGDLRMGHVPFNKEQTFHRSVPGRFFAT